MSQAAEIILDRTDQDYTTNQTSGVKTAKGAGAAAYILIEVQTGATLVLDVDVIAVFRDGEEAVIATTSASITGAGNSVWQVVPTALPADVGRITTFDVQTAMPTTYRVRVRHGNANPARYRVHVMDL